MVPLLSGIPIGTAAEVRPARRRAAVRGRLGALAHAPPHAPPQGWQRDAPHPPALQDLLDWLDDHGVGLGEARVFQHYTRAFLGEKIHGCASGQWFVLPKTADQWLTLRHRIDGATFGSSRVRVHMVRRSDFSSSLFGKGALFNVYSKGRHLEVRDVHVEVRSEQLVQVFGSYALDYLESREVNTALTGEAAMQARRMGIVHNMRASFLCFRTKEEAHRALRDHMFLSVAGRSLKVRIVR